MSLRIRETGDVVCAALYPEQPGDVYLDDAAHYRISVVCRALEALPAGRWRFVAQGTRDLGVDESAHGEFKADASWWRRRMADLETPDEFVAALKAEAEREYADEGAAGDAQAIAVSAEADALRSRLAKVERVVDAVRVMLKAPPVAGAWEAAAFERKLRADVYNALRALDAPDAGTDSGGSVPSAGSSASGCTPEPSEVSSPLDACDQRLARLGVPVARKHAPDPQSPATRAELEELQERMRTALGFAVAELKRRVERLERGPRRVG